MQHHVINFVGDLGQVGGFFHVLRFPPPIKLTAMIYRKWNIYIVENDVKHHNPNPLSLGYADFSLYKWIPVDAVGPSLGVPFLSGKLKKNKHPLKNTWYYLA